MFNFPPTLRFDFKGATALDSRITFTRASSAWYLDSGGVLQTASTDTPRFAYGQNLGVTGLLLERASSNVALWCRDFTNAAWTKTNITAALDQTGVDGGSNTASSLTANASNGTALQSRVLAAQDVLGSMFVKRITGSGGVDMTVDGGATWTAVTVTGSWTRVQIPTQNLANPNFGIRIQTNGDKIAVDAFCAERSATVGGMSSPILTTTTTVTRAVDVAKVTSLGSWFNAVEGAMRTTFGDPQDSSIVHSPASFSDGTASNRLRQSFTTNGVFLVSSGGANQANIGAGTIVAGRNRIASSYKANSFRNACNGVSGTADTSGSVPTVSELGLGSESSGATAMSAILTEFLYWNRSRGDGFLKAMSAV